MAKALPKDPVFYDIGGIFAQETEDAILLKVDGDDVWLPKSQIEYDESTERCTYMEVAVPDWLCEQKGLDDGDGIGKKTPAEPAPEPPVDYGEEDTVSFELFIDNVLEDGDLLIVEATSRYDKEKQEFVPVERMRLHTNSGRKTSRQKMMSKSAQQLRRKSRPAPPLKQA